VPRYTAEQIYAFARQAGFNPDEAATMTAIALAESGGDSRSHNTVGEDSRGLWQVNVRAHPDLANTDLYDPVQNARAAYQVSHGGSDVSPWTVTHGGASARYLRFRDKAEAAAAAYGDGSGHGVWTGTAGYGHPLSAGGSDHKDAGTPDGSDSVVVTQPTPPATASTPAPAHPPGGHGEEYGIPLDPDARAGAAYGIPLYSDAPGEPEAPDAPGALVAPPRSGPPGDTLHKFLDAAMAQTGDRYVFGAETRLGDPNPSTFDCSELVQWSAAQAGVQLEDGSWYQYQQLRDSGMLISVNDAIHTPGAVLMSFSNDPNGSHPPHGHIAISLGNGQTIEARGSRYSVGSWPAQGRFQYAALIPGISDHTGPVRGYPPAASAANSGLPVVITVDQQNPGDDFGYQLETADPQNPGDDFTYQLETDPDSMDTQDGAVDDSLILVNMGPVTDQPVPVGGVPLGGAANDDPPTADVPRAGEPSDHGEPPPDHGEPPPDHGDPADDPDPTPPVQPTTMDVDGDGLDDSLQDALRWSSTGTIDSPGSHGGSFDSHHVHHIGLGWDVDDHDSPAGH